MRRIFILYLIFCLHLHPLNAVFVFEPNALDNQFSDSSHYSSFAPAGLLLSKRDASASYVEEELPYRPSNNDGAGIVQKINFLNDSHKQLMVHWAGEGSDVIICLARDIAAPKSNAETSSTLSGSSSVYISYDYGDTFVNKTESFKLPNATYARVNKFYNHPKYHNYIIFMDSYHRVLFTTTNFGVDIKPIFLEFNPRELHFHDFLPTTFAATSEHNDLYVTENYGDSFVMVTTFVKSAFWMLDDDGEMELLIERIMPANNYTAIYTRDFSNERKFSVYTINVQKLFIKGNYIFTVKKSNTLELYVSDELTATPRLCSFGLLNATSHSHLDILDFYIADVTNDRALVVVSHSPTQSHLYVSDNLLVGSDNNSQVQFTLSLRNVFGYFPNITRLNNWMDQTLGIDTFADVYKVEGVTGIYIASILTTPTVKDSIGPQNLSSVITFDHGRSWRSIRPPVYEFDGTHTLCSAANKCSLHLNQKFSQMHPETRSIGILSSKSVPGLIMATGVLGRNLKGRYGVYISSDGGVTWRHTLRDLYYFNIADHGGLLMAVKYYRSKGETRYVLYSTNYGQSWNEFQFHSQNLRLYGLMTEPGENTTVFTMFGSKPDKHQWVIVKIDLMGQFERNCTERDFKKWSLGMQSDDNRNYIPCVLGQQLTFERRQPHANCYSGEYRNKMLDKPVSRRLCDCDVYDFECDFGFRRDQVAGHCVLDMSQFGNTSDPFAVPKSCSPGQYYTRSKGYRKIQGDLCVHGFEARYSNETIACPVAELTDFLLFAQRDQISRFNLVTRKLDVLPIKKLNNVVAIDFDMKNNCIYWADVTLDLIARQCLNGGDPPEVLVSTELASIEGMALDWISETLYFVDGYRGKIELIRTNVSHHSRMRRTILDRKHLQNPRGIAVHPNAGYLFWTDWSTDKPSVGRSNLDGSNIKVLFTKPVVLWPNGITVDYIAERIYWVDARQDYIASSDLHGDFYKKVISQPASSVSHPFAIAVFKRYMYWDDWKANAIFSADKENFNGGVEVVQMDMRGLMDLKVFAHGLQIAGPNPCYQNKTLCPYLCVAAPKDKYTCLCPDGMQEKYEGPTLKCLCPGGHEPFANLTCPKWNNTCSTGHFSCSNGVCIPKGWLCDGENDCGDNSDEKRCDPAVCPTNFFSCTDNSSKCLPHYFVCDYDHDCNDGSDELNCSRRECEPATQFRCKNERCIMKEWVCDGQDDCRDYSDEKDCIKVMPYVRRNCTEGEFTCEMHRHDNHTTLSPESGSVVANKACIPNVWRCDKVLDCPDGSDERDCDTVMCLDTQFFCGPGSNKCIYLNWLCDGDRDCPDGIDERNCTSMSPRPPPPFQDGNGDLDEKSPDMEIELFGPVMNGSCQSGMFTCLDSNCIPAWWRCDGVKDCLDGSDEHKCSSSEISPQLPIDGAKMPLTTTQPTDQNVCGNNQFYCPNNGGCIFDAWLCDNMVDCPGGEDEENCEYVLHCRDNEFKCKQDGSCVPQQNLCDGGRDCPDASDEFNCMPNVASKAVNYTDALTCPKGFFSCLGACLPLSKRCNGFVDCKYGQDEANCTNFSPVYQVMDIYAKETDNDGTVHVQWMPAEPHDNISLGSSDTKLMYMPKITTLDGNNRNNDNYITEWNEHGEYEFHDLEPFTQYKIWVLARLGSTVFPPSKFIIYETEDGVPSEPWNLTVHQLNDTTMDISWLPPVSPKGLIVSYMLSWSPPYPPIALVVPGNRKSHRIRAEFGLDKDYEFTVQAQNKLYTGVPGKIKYRTDNDAFRSTAVSDIRGKLVGDRELMVSWKWNEELKVDGFKVECLPHRNANTIGLHQFGYPPIPPVYTQKMNALFENLSPGVRYNCIIQPYRGNTTGHSGSIVSVKMRGKELSMVPALKAVDNYVSGKKNISIRWERVKDDRNLEWVYGIYQSTDPKAFKRAPILLTKKTTAVLNVTHEDCQGYIINVGIVGPIGNGPLSNEPIYLSFGVNSHFAPVNVSVRALTNEPTKAEVKWEPGCQLAHTNDSFFVQRYDLITAQKDTFKTANNQYSIVLNGELGARYAVAVANAAADLIKYTNNVTYEAPPIPRLHGLRIMYIQNHQWYLNWTKAKLPKSVGGFRYDILVSPGPRLNLTMAHEISIDEPPFLYLPHKLRLPDDSVYSFAVRVHTLAGYTSPLSEQISLRNIGGSWGPMENLVTAWGDNSDEMDQQVHAESNSTGLRWLLGLSLVGLVPAVVGLIMLYRKHRRLQNNFSRFANSHYNRRSGAAVFGDEATATGTSRLTLGSELTAVNPSSHEDDDDDDREPQIMGFCDDEPLVIA